MPGSMMTFAYDEVLGTRKLIATWLSDDTDGTAQGTTHVLMGELMRGVAIPGDPAPENGYSIFITDEFGIDVLDVATDDMEGCSATVADEHYFHTESGGEGMAEHPYISGPLTIAIMGAGNARRGKLALSIRNI